MLKDENVFEYSYSAKEQEEIDKIRKKYIITVQSKHEDRLERIKALDDGVTNKATVISLIVGILGSLIMGTGMSLIMTEIGEELGTYFSIILGIVLGITGMLGVIFAYPLYSYILKKLRKKIAPQILKLTDDEQKDK